MASLLNEDQVKTDGPIDDDKLAAIIGKQIADARLFYNSDREGYRDKAIRYFEGECPDVPPMGDNRSKVVSRDVADVHGMIMPSLLRVFFSSDKIAIYEPTRKEQEQFAAQATDYVNYVVMKECDGYRYFRDAISDGLLLGNGILKHYWDTTPEYKTESFSGLSEVSYKLLAQDPEIVEVLEEKSYPDPNWVPPQPALPDGTGGAMPAIPGMGPSPQTSPEIAAAPVASPGGQPSQLPPMGAPTQPQLPAGPQGAPDQTGMVPDQTAPLMYDCVVKRKVSNGRLKITAIPYEEFLIDRGTRVLDEEHCRFAAHVRLRTRSSLIEEGYDREKVAELPSFTDIETWQNREIRDRLVSFNQEGPDKSTDLIEIHECYVQLDANGDGVAEWMRVVMGGIQGQRNILAKEEWGDDLPFSDIVPDPRPYAWRGFGLYDLLNDIQKMKTVALRAVMDNTYWVLNPQRVVISSLIENMDEVINPTFGGTINTKGPGAIDNLETPYIVDKVSPVIDYLDTVAEKRTGISRQSQALDLDVLQNQSATAVNAATSAAFSKVEEYARNIAECGGLKRAFACILKLIVKHQDKPKTIRLRGKWVDMDPRAWDANMDVSVNTGLGAGSRERDLQMLSNILGIQQQAISAAGPTNPLAGIDKIANTCIKLCETSGIKSPEQFFNEITPEQMQQMSSQPPPPDPKMIMAQVAQFKAQADAQVAQQKSQADMAIQQSEHQSNQIRAMAEIEKSRAEAQVKIIEANSKAREAELQARETGLQQRLAVAQIQLEQMKATAQNQTTLAKAAIDNLVKLEIARINASKDTDQHPDAIEQRLSNDAGVPWHGNTQPQPTGAQGQ